MFLLFLLLLLFQENGDVCEDCVKFLTDTQEQAKSNATFVNALIEQIEAQCDLLGPGLSDMVCVLPIRGAIG